MPAFGHCIREYAQKSNPKNHRRQERIRAIDGRLCFPCSVFPFRVCLFILIPFVGSDTRPLSSAGDIIQKSIISSSRTNDIKHAHTFQANKAKSIILDIIYFQNEIKYVFRQTTVKAIFILKWYCTTDIQGPHNCTG